VKDLEIDEPFDAIPPTPLLSSAPNPPAKAALATTALTEPEAGPSVVVVQFEKLPDSKPSAKRLPLTGVAVMVAVAVIVAVGVLVGGVPVAVDPLVAVGLLVWVAVLVGDTVLVAVAVLVWVVLLVADGVTVGPPAVNVAVKVESTSGVTRVWVGAPPSLHEVSAYCAPPGPTWLAPLTVNCQPLADVTTAGVV
jgi:hypothetical protein